MNGPERPPEKTTITELGKTQTARERVLDYLATVDSHLVTGKPLHPEDVAEARGLAIQLLLAEDIQNSISHLAAKIAHLGRSVHEIESGRIERSQELEERTTTIISNEVGRIEEATTKLTASLDRASNQSGLVGWNMVLVTALLTAVTALMAWGMLRPPAIAQGQVPEAGAPAVEEG